ncbi:MAG: DNA polymerase I [Myxococcales bacterium]|nr:DNA polymerase I [Myxococcales bacterium]
MAHAPRLVLVDGSAMFFRAYYAIPGNFRNSEGIPTNAVYGFATMFRKLFAGRTPEKGVVVFDAPGPTFRHAQFPDYKANRAPPPDDLIRQRPWVDRVAEAYGFTILRVPGYEADDVIGTLSTRAVRAGYEVTIVSADKDFVQLLGPAVKMFDPFTGAGTTYDVDRATKKWGIPPEKFIDFLALIGDKIDNIPGVPGIGKKGAAELLETYGTLDAIFSHLDELKGRKRAALEEHAKDARLSQTLATIETQVPLPISLEDLDEPTRDDTQLNSLYKELEFYSLLTDDAIATDSTTSFNLIYITTSQELSEWLHVASQNPPVAVEPIADSPLVSSQALSGLVLTQDGQQVAYIDTREHIPQALIKWLEDETITKITHEVKRLYILLGSMNIRLAGVIGDTQLSSFLIDPNKLLPHRLDQIAREYLQTPLTPVKKVLGTGKSETTFRALPPQDISNWAAQRVSTIIQSWIPLSKDLENEGLHQQLSEVDLPLAACLARMERVGIGVDTKELFQIEDEFCQRRQDIEEKVFELAGQSFNIRSTKQLAKILFEDLKLKVIKKTKTGYSTSAEVLERLASDHEIATHLLEHRKYEKLINTYTQVLRNAVQPDTGRVHASFKQTAGVTGRLITTDPDLQRTPIKTPEGERIRQAFIARPGHKLISADWSQIELRLLAHVSQDPVLLRAFQENHDIHQRTASELMGLPLNEVTKEQRRIGKTVNFATVYGQGATALSQILKISRKEADNYINQYFQLYSGVRSWLDNTIRVAQQTGYVETLNGRRRYIPELSSNAAMERAAGERIAANTPIQGSAADICKAAMLVIDNALREKKLKSEMVLQIHDELLFECPENEVETVSALVRHHMSTIVILTVPLVADVGVGQNWAEAH